jgi:CheY-like chemotaxis protein
MVGSILRDRCSRVARAAGTYLPERPLLYNEEGMPATILLVEDNPLARRNMTIFFKTHGYEVLEAQRGEEALRLIRDVDNFDVVITDLRMPGMIDGLEVLRVQNEVSPGTKAILVTAYGSNQIRYQAAALGAVYLDKPVQLDDLLLHVRQLTCP